jgi:hypothetical protein
MSTFKSFRTCLDSTNINQRCACITFYFLKQTIDFSTIFWKGAEKLYKYSYKSCLFCIYSPFYIHVKTLLLENLFVAEVDAT